MIATNDLIYLVTNVFYVYILCKFMRAFFGQKGRNQKAEILSFAAYYCVNSFLYVGFHMPVLTIMSNLFCYYVLTINYEAKIGYRFIGVVFIYALLSCSEAIALLVLRFVGLNHFSEFNTKEYVIAQIFIGVICYVLVLIFSNCKLKKNSSQIPTLYWVAIIIVPVGTLFPILMISESLNSDHIIQILISAVLLLI